MTCPGFCHILEGVLCSSQSLVTEIYNNCSCLSDEPLKTLKKRSYSANDYADFDVTNYCTYVKKIGSVFRDSPWSVEEGYVRFLYE